ncbi:hypothetical protein DFP72DRAFT_877988 [Ephemerocybe angulata]|uniref:RING-type domain-containing protein n=1 Tax=Ephemerocybe angulata TaxID=980116 RepID=A0A8H6ID82_9AGAR|nr:hypothetical protein DFP72DRAFT_877988 [Tulosesus angulatus]
MVTTRSTGPRASTSKATARNLDSITAADSDSSPEADEQNPLNDISDCLKKLQGAFAKVKKDVQRLRKEKEEVEEQLDEEREDAKLSVHTRRRALNTPNAIAKLEDEIKALKAENRKKDKVIAKLKDKALKEEAQDLLDTAPDGEDGIDPATRMRKLLRKFSDLMLVGTLDDDEKCPICMEPMELEKCSAFDCEHLICNDCLKQILPKDEQFMCPVCRGCTAREDFKLVCMTGTHQWDELLKVAAAWDAYDRRPEVDTSEEEAEENFITDASEDEVSSEANDGDATDASAPEVQTDDGEQDSERPSTPVSRSSSPAACRLSYSQSPSKVKRKRLQELAEERAKKRQR